MAFPDSGREDAENPVRLYSPIPVSPQSLVGSALTRAYPLVADRPR